MNWKGIEYFLHIADVGSISVAARDLGIVQPALSRQMQRLEEEIGARLFDRLPRGVQLTDAGKLFYERCRRITHDFVRAKHDAAAIQHVPSGDVTLGMPGTIAAALAPRLIRRIRNEAPSVRLRIVGGSTPFLHEALLAGRLQTSILTAPVSTRKLGTVPLGTEDIALFQSADVPRFRGSCTLEHVVRLPLLMCAGIRRLVDAQIFETGKKLSVEAEIDSLDALRPMVLGGIGPTLLPVSTLRREVEEGSITLHSISDFDLRRVLVLAHPKQEMSPATEIVARMVRLEMARLGEMGALSTAPPDRRAEHRAVRPPARRRNGDGRHAKAGQQYVSEESMGV